MALFAAESRHVHHLCVVASDDSGNQEAPSVDRRPVTLGFVHEHAYILARHSRRDSRVERAKADALTAAFSSVPADRPSATSGWLPTYFSFFIRSHGQTFWRTSQARETRFPETWFGGSGCVRGGLCTGRTGPAGRPDTVSV